MGRQETSVPHSGRMAPAERSSLLDASGRTAPCGSGLNYPFSAPILGDNDFQ